MPAVQLHDRSFVPYLSPTQIAERVNELGRELNQSYAGRSPLLVAVLNGAFLFAADLMRSLATPCEIAFVRVASYQGTQSTGQVHELLGLTEEIAGRDVILLEDIVDTGTTVMHLRRQLAEKGPISLEVATFLFKPTALKHGAPPKYVGFEIPDRFVVGYGLDYNGLGRNLPGVYVLQE